MSEGKLKKQIKTAEVSKTVMRSALLRLLKSYETDGEEKQKFAHVEYDALASSSDIIRKYIEEIGMSSSENAAVSGKAVTNLYDVLSALSTTTVPPITVEAKFLKNIHNIHGVVRDTIHELSSPEKSTIFSKSEYGQKKLLLKKFQEKKVIVAALKTLNIINSEFLNFDRHLTAGDVQGATTILINIGKKYFQKNTSITAIIPPNSKIFQVVKDQYVQKKNEIQSELNGIFSTFISISSDPCDNDTKDISSIKNTTNDFNVNKLSIKQTVKVSSSTLYLHQIFLSFSCMNLLSNKLQAFANNVLKTMIIPLIQNPIASIHLSKRTYSDLNEEFIIAIEYKEEADDLIAYHNDKEYTPNEMLERVINIVNFIYEKIFSVSTTSTDGENEAAQKEAFALFSHYLWRGTKEISGYESNNGREGHMEGYCGMCPLLLKELKLLVPQERLLKAEDIEALQHIFKAFEEKLVNIGFFQKNMVGQTKLAKYINSLDTMEAMKRQSALLGRARLVMMGDYFNSIIVDENNNYHPGEVNNDATNGNKSDSSLNYMTYAGDNDEKRNNSSSNMDNNVDGDNGYKQTTVAFVLEKMAVTVCVKTLISYAHEALQEMNECTQKGKWGIWSAVKDMFSLFRAIVPFVHREQINNMPRVAMLHYNDCLYICHHLMIFDHMYGEQLPASYSDNDSTKITKTNMIDLASPFRQMAGQIYAKELFKQHVEISMLMKDVDEENPNNKASELSKKGTAMHLSRLFKVWSEILDLKTLKQTIGLLVSKIPIALFPDVISYVNNRQEIELFENSRNICRPKELH